MGVRSHPVVAARITRVTLDYSKIFSLTLTKNSP